jgi:hypothetical protein
VLHRVLELEEEIDIFLSGNNNNDANLCYNKDSIQKQVYMEDFLKKYVL